MSAAERQRQSRARKKASGSAVAAKKKESETKCARLQKLKAHPEEYKKHRKSLNEYERVRRNARNLEKWAEKSSTGCTPDSAAPTGVSPASAAHSSGSGFSTSTIYSYTEYTCKEHTASPLYKTPITAESMTPMVYRKEAYYVSSSGLDASGIPKMVLKIVK